MKSMYEIGRKTVSTALIWIQIAFLDFIYDLRKYEQYIALFPNHPFLRNWLQLNYADNDIVYRDQ